MRERSRRTFSASCQNAMAVETAMRGHQTMLWMGISLMTGAICLGAPEPQLSKVGQAVLSVEVNRGLDGVPMVLIPAGPFTIREVTMVSQASVLNIP